MTTPQSIRYLRFRHVGGHKGTVCTREADNGNSQNGRHDRGSQVGVPHHQLDGCAGGSTNGANVPTVISRRETGLERRKPRGGARRKSCSRR